MSYDEHLISMAGGDGDMADVISDAAYEHVIGLSDIDVKNLAAALTTAGFGPAREQQAKLDAVEKLLDEKYKLWAAICGNTCSKDIVGVDHEAIADEIAAAIRAVTVRGGA